MISPTVVGAVSALQSRALASHDNYELDRLDRALDELLRNPSDTMASVPQRIRSAMGHAYEVLERRRVIAASTSLDPEHFDCAWTDHQYAVVDILSWLHTEPRFDNRERCLLGDLARGLDAASLATRHGVPLPRMRERISRTRSRARALWRTEVVA